MKELACLPWHPSPFPAETEENTSGGGHCVCEGETEAPLVVGGREEARVWEWIGLELTALLCHSLATGLSFCVPNL